MQDAITVALVRGAILRLFFRVAAPFGILAAYTVKCQALVFNGFKFFSGEKHGFPSPMD
jgi:hypothetical protein